MNISEVIFKSIEAISTVRAESIILTMLTEATQSKNGTVY